MVLYSLNKKKGNAMEIRVLEKQKWKGYMLDMSYTSDYYYDYKRVDSELGWSFIF